MSGPSKPRQRPTLPQTCACSTIGPGELNFRVRDGNGCDLSGKAAGNLEARILSDSKNRVLELPTLTSTPQDPSSRSDPAGLSLSKN